MLEKLYRLIRDFLFNAPDVSDMNLAEYLITNGVTFQNWIPVSERLPGIYKAVIVWTEYHEIGEAQYNGKHFEWLDDEGDYDYAHVTHWMPLPEPPKE